jgi:hypothetical protein
VSHAVVRSSRSSAARRCGGSSNAMIASPVRAAPSTSTSIVVSMTSIEMAAQVAASSGCSTRNEVQPASM